MNDHNSELPQDGYAANIDDIDNINHYYQQTQEFQDLKLQEELVKQHYGSPTGSPQQQFTPSGPAAIGPVYDGVGELGELGELEKLSHTYSPVYTVKAIQSEKTPLITRPIADSVMKGPLVGELRSIKELGVEYVDADPVYVVKTAALYPGYSHYRKIRGDGNCAWRAIAYGYFELLLRTGNPDFIIGEQTRIASFGNLLNNAGFAPIIWEDFAEETSTLFQRISSSPMIDNPDDTTELEKIFNTDSDSIIAHFKFLTSAWMRNRREAYSAYLDTTIEEYCSSSVEPFWVELDHAGVQALIDCLVNPAGLRVEISYLDRSSGAEVNVHAFDSEALISTSERPRSTMSLLYRPGHYDIIYKRGDIPNITSIPDGAQMAPASPVQVSFMSQLPDQYFASTPLNYFLGPGGGMQVERRAEDKDKFRASLFQYPPFQPSPLPFQTSIFRNSAYNPSHYQSENFQPELYQPEVTQRPESHGNGRKR